MNKIEERMIAKILAGSTSKDIKICTNTKLRVYNTGDGWNNDRVDVTVYHDLVACYYPYLGPNNNGIIYLYTGNSSDLILSRIDALIEGLGFDKDKPALDTGIFWESDELAEVYTSYIN